MWQMNVMIDHVLFPLAGKRKIARLLTLFYNHLKPHLSASTWMVRNHGLAKRAC